jgi:hypothetical protein
VLVPNLTLAKGQGTDVVVGIPWQGEPGITESVADIMAREGQVRAMALRAGNKPPEPRETHRKLLSHRETLPQNPDALKIETTAPTQGSLASTFAPQTVGTSFVGARLADSGFIPPDSMGAPGRTQFLICVNGRIRTFTKAGVIDEAIDTTTDTFFASVRSSSGTSDPRVIFDRLSQRWFIVMINVSTPNRVLIAMSSGATITGASSFSFFQFQHDLVGPTPNTDTGNFADYPSLGVDSNALYIGVNMFAGNTFAGTTGFVVQKSALLSASLVVTAFRQLATSTGPGPYSPRGVANDDPSATEGYFIGTDNAFFGRLTMRRISDPGGTPSISGNISISVPTTSFPANVPAQKSTNPLDALDDRLFSAVQKNGSLWTAHNSGVDSTGTASSTPDRDAVRWYEITGLTSTPALNQAGTLFDASASNPKYYWIGSVATSGQGHMALGASYAGAADFAGVALSGRLATDPLGSLQAPTLVASTFSYNVQNVSSQRWGDYSFTMVDPSNDMTMWTVQEFCDATDSWGVYVAKLMAPPPATPSSASPSSANQGTSLDVRVTGTSVNASGFYDPAPTLPNHISATVDGAGVIVNSTSFIDPTTVTLNLTIASDAAVGAHTIRVTNPDGQSAVSATGIFTVNSGGFSLSAAPSSLTIARGNSGTYRVSVSALNGFSGTVNLRVSDVPSRVTASFNPPTVSGSGSSVLTIRAGRRSSTGTYRLAITGSSGNLVHSASVTLVLK